MSRIDLSGQTVGKLFLVDKLEPIFHAKKKPMGLYLCKCECGEFTKRTSQYLRQTKKPACERCAVKGRPTKELNYESCNDHECHM